MWNWFLVSTLLSSAPPEAGSYRITRDQIDVQKEIWGLFCGATPDKQPPSVGSLVEVSRRGTDWVAQGGRRRFGSATCEGSNPSLAPVSRRVDGEWTEFSCQSQRVTRGTESTTHRVRVTADGTLEFRTQGQNEFRKDGDLCRLRFERSTRAVPVAPSGKQGVAAEPEKPCATPQGVHSLRLSPKVFDAKVGAKPVCLDVSAADVNGCAVATKGVRFSVDPPGAGTVNRKGCFRASSKLKEEEAVAVIAKLGDQEAVATARVVPAKKTRGTIGLKALANASRSRRAREVLGEVTRGEVVLRPVEPTYVDNVPAQGDTGPAASRENDDGGRRGVLLGLGGVAGAMLLGLWGWAARRRRLAVAGIDASDAIEAKPVVTPTVGGGLVCPSCSFEFAVGDATVCPFDGTTLVALARDARQTMFVPAAGGMVCPVCRSRFPTKSRFCGHDRAPLVPDFGQFDSDADAQ